MRLPFSLLLGRGGIGLPPLWELTITIKKRRRQGGLDARRRPNTLLDTRSNGRPPSRISINLTSHKLLEAL